MIRPQQLSRMKDRELLKLFSTLMEELRGRELVRSSNNPVADFAERTAAEHMNLTRLSKEERGYDAVDENGKKYQIKGRRVTKHNTSRQLGVVRNLEQKPFDYLVAVIFNEDFSVNEIWKIPYRFVREHSRFSKHQNGHILIARSANLEAGKGVERIR